MSIFYIAGKPRGGKSYLAVEALYKELCDVKTGRLIVTNIPLMWDEREIEVKVRPGLAEMLKWYFFGIFRGCPRPVSRIEKKIVHGISYWLERDVPDVNLFEARRRVRVLNDQETGEFWCYEPGVDFLKRKSIKINRRGTEIEVPDFTYEDGSVRGDIAKGNPGTFYVIDEVHIFFPARAWQRTGEDCTFFLSQHGKMKCDVCMVTQHVDQCDKALRRLAQEYMTVRNLSREPVMGFRLGSVFRFNRMLNSPTSANPYIFDSGFKRMDFEKYGSMYDTSAGVGITGTMVPNVEKRGRSLVWLLFPLAAFVAFWFYFGTIAKGFQHLITKGLTHAIPGMRQKMAGAMNIPVSSSPVAGAGAVFPNETTSESIPTDKNASAVVPGRNRLAEKPKKVELLPYWNPEGFTNLEVTGWIRTPATTRIFLSNGRVLPAAVVAVVNDYCVTLYDGTRLPVKVVKSEPLKFDDGQAWQSSPAVMSLPESPGMMAGAGRIHNGNNALSPR
jgi:hypothetical protein